MSIDIILQALGCSPADAKTFEDYVERWKTVAAASKALSDLEMRMRKHIFAAAFPDPTEGVNKRELNNGALLKATHKINRSVDETQIALARSEYALLNDPPVPFDDLLRVKYDLVTSAYRKIPTVDESGKTPAALAAVSRMIVAKPGSPTLEVV